MQNNAATVRAGSSVKYAVEGDKLLENVGAERVLHDNDDDWIVEETLEFGDGGPVEVERRLRISERCCRL